MLGISLTGVWFRCNGFNPHFAHKSLDSFTINFIPLTSQKIPHLPGAIKRMFSLKFPFRKGTIILRYQVVGVFTDVALLTTFLLFGVDQVLFAALDLVLCTL